MCFVLWYGLGREGLVCGIVLALVVIYRHGENLERLRRGTENRLSLLKAGPQQ
jgi:glycerol-3-phosphate acyltransferase PlsY